MLKKTILALLVAFIFLLQNSHGEGENQPEKLNIKFDYLSIEDNIESYILGPYLYILEDSKNRIDFANIISGDIDSEFNRNDSDVPGFGFTDSFFWLAFRIKVISTVHMDWKLELDYPLMDNIDLYIPDKKTGYKKISTGYNYPFSEREYSYSNFVFDLGLEPGNFYTVYIRVKSGDRIELPLYILSSRALSDKVQNRMFLYGLYFGLIIVIVILNMILYISVRDISYLYYVIFALSIGLYQLTQNGFAYKYIFPVSLAGYNHYSLVLIVIMLFCGIQFSQTFLNMKISMPFINKLFNIYKLFYLPCMLLPFFISYSLSNKISFILAIPAMPLVFISGIFMIYKKYPPSKYFVVAWGALIAGASVYVLKNLGIISPGFLTSNSLYIGSSLELVILTVGLGERINLMRRDKEVAQRAVIDAQKEAVRNLEKSNEMIREANRNISLSERRYKHLVEDSKDMIFSLDRELNFLTVNRSVRMHLNLKPEEICKWKFEDVLFEGFTDRDVSKKIILEKLDIFVQKKEAIIFRADFKTALNGEPREMIVRMEYIEGDEGGEIIGKASPASEDALINNLEYEKQVLTIGNYLISADELSLRLTRNLIKYLPRTEVNLVRIALREMVINAIEHGNLNISFDEKTRSILNNQYFEFIMSRQQHPMYMGKRIKIEYVIDQDHVKYIIEDEGSGFNHKEILNEIVNIANRDMLSHGRGIAMTMDVFDEVKYNDAGNIVQLLKYYKSS